MTTEKQIQIIVERNILFDPTCETKRKLQQAAALNMRLELEELVRKIQMPKPYDPRTEIK